MLASLHTASRFPALGNPHFRLYWWTVGLAMAADTVEHVIGYWVIWEYTHSPFWLGYAVVSHWLPFLLFSMYFGSVADRFDSRWLIQISQAMYVFCSLAWGLLYLIGQLQLWHIAIILLVHGFAGVVFHPSSYLLIHQMVASQDLMSAISLNASQRQVSVLLGPVIGGALMAAVGPGWGFLINVLIYLPLSWAMVRLPYGQPSGGTSTSLGWGATIEGLRYVRQQRLIVGLLLMVAVTSLLVGNAYQSLMPAFADLLQVGALGYGILLAANGLGAILGVIGLGLLGARHLRPAVVTWSTLGWALLLVLFAVSRWYSFSLTVLLANGVLYIIYISMAQTIIQSWAPAAVRGRVMGVFSLASLGVRVGSGFTLGLLGNLLGVPLALVVCGLVIAVATLAISGAVPALWQRYWEPTQAEAARAG